MTVLEVNRDPVALTLTIVSRFDAPIVSFGPWPTAPDETSSGKR